jgi:hypothetical protein
MSGQPICLLEVAANAAAGGGSVPMTTPFWAREISHRAAFKAAGTQPISGPTGSNTWRATLFITREAMHFPFIAGTNAASDA